MLREGEALHAAMSGLRGDCPCVHQGFKLLQEQAAWHYMRFMPVCLQIGEAVLVELPGCSVQHEDTTRLALRAISPEASLTVLHLERA